MIVLTVKIENIMVFRNIVWNGVFYNLMIHFSKSLYFYKVIINQSKKIKKYLILYKRHS